MTAPRTTRRDPNKILERRVQNALTTIYDPATPHIDLFNMGMVYRVGIADGGRVEIDLAFSSPGHPGNLLLPKQVADAIRELEGVSDCKVKIVTDPPWTLDRVSDHARVNMSVVGS
ncbi:MAG: metal-sulfur cluster assembly factor [Gammaproteobacteria bacterium]